MENSIFGERLKQLRLRLKLTQREMADELGITPASLSSYEVGGKIPTLPGAFAIAEKYNVSLDWLCGAENENKIINYQQILQLVFAIEKNAELDVSGVLFQIPSAYDSVYDADDVPYGTGIAIYDNKVIEFLGEWEKMRRLYRAGTIDEELYSFWKEKQLKKYDLPITRDNAVTNPDNPPF